MVTLRLGWALIAVTCWACGGESSSSGTGGTHGTGASAGSDGGGSGGAAGGVTGGAGGSVTGGAGGSVTGGAGGNVSGGSGGTAASGGSAGAGGAAGAAGSGGTGPVDCDPGKVLCKAMPPTCNPGEVPSVQGSCWGPCVPILACNTVTDCSACTSGFCAAYQAFTTQYRCVMPSIQCQALACSCLAQYFCVTPYDACSSAGGGTKPAVTCSCPTC